MPDPIKHVLRFFEYEHLPEGKIRDASKMCALMARGMVTHTVNHGPELTVALRKLLEAKDAFVRANLPQGES